MCINQRGESFHWFLNAASSKFYSTQQGPLSLYSRQESAALLWFFILLKSVSIPQVGVPLLRLSQKFEEL